MKKQLSLGEMALSALKDAVARVIEEHRRDGQPLAVWKDGKVVLIPPPEPTTVREKPARNKSK
jgi:hypothetical protein